MKPGGAQESALRGLAAVNDQLRKVFRASWAEPKAPKTTVSPDGKRCRFTLYATRLNAHRVETSLNNIAERLELSCRSHVSGGAVMRDITVTVEGDPKGVEAFTDEVAARLSNPQPAISGASSA